MSDRTGNAGRAARNLLSAACLGVLVSACTGSSELGVTPPVDRLAELRVGVSAKDEVRRVIGPPQGKGASRIPDFPGYRDLWSYEVFSTDGSTADYAILLIFFKGDIYDGHLWFDNSHTLEGML